MNDRRRVGNWDFDDDRVERERLRRDFRELTPSERLRQTIAISEFQLKLRKPAGRHSA